MPPLRCVFQLLALLPALLAAEAKEPAIVITLDTDKPSESAGVIGDHRFPVGFGKQGVLPEGERFRGGHSLLGRFKVNAVLAPKRFMMTPDLILESKKGEAFLRKNLFRNMSLIDFDGDGKGGEYGKGFISLEPVGGRENQPFSFQPYRGTFRWYSYALHGTQDESRVGRMSTGGCINLKAADLAILLGKVELGDLVEIRKR